MVKLPTAIIVAIFIVVLLGVNSEAKARNKRETVEIIGGSDLLSWLCQNSQWASYLGSWCNTVTTTTTPAPVPSTAQSTAPSAGGSPPSTGGSTSSASTSSSSPSPLQNAFWCQLSNGTHLTNGQTYLQSQSPCSMCQCTQSRAVVCKILTCMPTYCIDGSTPTVQSGNCCPTCAYETQALSCTSGASTFPHGTLITTIANSTQCWCEQGNIECRRPVAVVTTTTTTWDYFSSATTAYIIVIVIALVLVLGAMLCCGCTLLYYYYYKNQQQAIQQAYEQYYNNAGWQPMGEEGQVGDATDEQKRAEAEQGQFENHYPTGHTPEFVPPPYAVFNGPYGGAEHKDQRQV